MGSILWLPWSLLCVCVRVSPPWLLRLIWCTARETIAGEAGGSDVRAAGRRDEGGVSSLRQLKDLLVSALDGKSTVRTLRSPPPSMETAGAVSFTAGRLL